MGLPPAKAPHLPSLPFWPAPQGFPLNGPPSSSTNTMTPYQTPLQLDPIIPQLSFSLPYLNSSPSSPIIHLYMAQHFTHSISSPASHTTNSFQGISSNGPLAPSNALAQPPSPHIATATLPLSTIYSSPSTPATAMLSTAYTSPTSSTRMQGFDSRLLNATSMPIMTPRVVSIPPLSSIPFVQAFGG